MLKSDLNLNELKNPYYGITKRNINRDSFIVLRAGNNCFLFFSLNKFFLFLLFVINFFPFQQKFITLQIKQDNMS